MTYLGDVMVTYCPNKLPYRLVGEKNNYFNISSALGVRNSGRAHLDSSSAPCGNDLDHWVVFSCWLS